MKLKIKFLNRQNYTKQTDKVTIMWTRELRAERTLAIVNNLERVMDIITTNFLDDRDKFDGNFVNAIRDFLTKNDAIAVIKKCSECRCCERHENNRPETLEWREYNGQCQGDQEEHECKCNCRHFSRWVCRAYRND